MALDIIIDENRRLWSRLEGGHPIPLADLLAKISPGSDVQMRLYYVRSSHGDSLEPLSLRSASTTLELKAHVGDVTGELVADHGGDSATATGATLAALGASLQSALNGITEIHDAGGVRVSVLGLRGLLVTWESYGARDLITVDASNLAPQPDATVEEIVAGDADTRAVQRILLGDRTLATVTTWNTITARDTYEFTQAGDTDAAAIYEVALSDPAPAAGSFTLDLGGTVTAPIPIGYGATKFQSVIDDAWGAVFTVRKPYPYTWRLQRTAVGALTTPTGDFGGIVWHPGVDGTADLSGLDEIAAHRAGASVELELVVRADVTSTGDEEIYRGRASVPAAHLES